MVLDVTNPTVKHTHSTEIRFTLPEIDDPRDMYIMLYARPYAPGEAWAEVWGEHIALQTYDGEGEYTFTRRQAPGYQYGVSVTISGVGHVGEIVPLPFQPS